MAVARFSPAAVSAARDVGPRPRSSAAGLAREAGALAPEIAFLAAQGIAPDILLRAMRAAAEAGVSADRALLGEDFPEEAFYRLLARHLGLPYLSAPLALAAPQQARAAESKIGVEPLVRNRLGLRFVLAPRGQVLREVLRHMKPGRARGAGLAIASPHRLEALVRRRDRQERVAQASSGLADWDRRLSAKSGLATGQRVIVAMTAAIVCAGLVFAPATAWAAACLVICALFLASILVRLAATAASPVASAPACPPLPAHDLPFYTVLVPLHREAGMVPQLVAALDALDYPRAKLDIKLILEAGDLATIAAVEALRLPARYSVLVAPPGQPRTKPRALNLALAEARGALLVVYDAEDRPEPTQLRAAAAAFRARSRHVACLQAELAIDHPDETWLTRMFALEYAGLFGVVMPGLAALGLPVPLGGTSNHFRVDALRRVNGWDAWNVTEDIDLGFRLARFGYRVEALPSTTFEEAPLTLAAWLPQRRRWLKGWIVTLGVHTREPGRVLRELGPRSAVSVFSALFGTVLSGLFGPAFVGLVAVRAWTGALLHPTNPWDAGWSALSCFLLLTGAAAAVWPVALGIARRRRLDLLPWLATLPLYLLLFSLASWLALAEALRRPHSWNKTEHGLARQRAGSNARG